jgi:hypothetical protein
MKINSKVEYSMVCVSSDFSHVTHITQTVRRQVALAQTARQQDKTEEEL